MNEIQKKISEQAAINAGHEKMLKWLQEVKFRRTFFQGIDEQDLWKKLEELNGLYEAALLAERARYDALLEEAKASGAPNPS